MFSFIDFHCDTITSAIKNDENLFENKRQIDFNRLLKFNAPVQVFAVWLDKESLKSPYLNTVKAIDFFKNQINLYNDYINFSVSYDDVAKSKNDNKISGLLAVEGGEALEGSIQNLVNLYDMGVRILTLTWNFKNELGYGALSEDNKGLTDFGKLVIKKMNELKMIIDVSHLNEKGFWDVYNESSQPFIASHSNCYACCSSKRNLTDEQIIAISKCNGMIGLNMYPFFLSNSGHSNIDDIFRHVDHILNLVGENCIGLGCDFDGIDVFTRKITDITCLNYLYESFCLYFGDRITDKIFEKNFMKFIEKNL